MLGSEEVWLDLVHRRRAVLSTDAPGADEHLRFEAYMPFDTWIGPSHTLVSLPGQVLGSSLSELQARTPAMILQEDAPSRDFPDGSYGLRLPRTEWTRGPGTNTPLTLTNNRVTGLSFDVPCRDAVDCAAKQKLLDERWGTYVDSKYGHVYREGSTQIVVWQIANSMSFTVRSVP